jgi:hypothetical protein
MEPYPMLRIIVASSSLELVRLIFSPGLVSLLEVVKILLLFAALTVLFSIPHRVIKNGLNDWWQLQPSARILFSLAPRLSAHPPFSFAYDSWTIRYQDLDLWKPL